MKSEILKEVKELYDNLHGVNPTYLLIERFENILIIDDWRKHIPGSIINVWHELTDNERMIFVIMAYECMRIEDLE